MFILCSIGERGKSKAEVQGLAFEILSIILAYRLGDETSIGVKLCPFKYYNTQSSKQILEK